MATVCLTPEDKSDINTGALLGAETTEDITTGALLAAKPSVVIGDSILLTSAAKIGLTPLGEC